MIRKRRYDGEGTLLGTAHGKMRDSILITAIAQLALPSLGGETSLRLVKYSGVQV
jgi:hypothetical protein